MESFLARVYTDPAARAAFLADPVGAARRAGLPETMAADFASIDRRGLAMQARSFAAKRSRRFRPGRLR